MNDIAPSKKQDNAQMGAKKMKSGLGSKLKNMFSLGGNKKSSSKAQAKNNL